MELLFAVLEGLLWVLDIICTGAQVYSWFKGKENRTERREARRAGLELPPRDKWNERVVVLTIAVCLLTLVLLTWFLARRSSRS